LLKTLEERIDYSFNDIRLLERALTHRSYAHEQQPGASYLHNEAMEFLGDSILGFVVSSWLFELFPKLPEGKLSKMKAYLVSAASLVEHAHRIGLGEFLRLNKGEEKTGGRRKRALLVDAYEALIAAIYLDGGIEKAEQFVRDQLTSAIQQVNPDDLSKTDYKSALQEELQARNLPAPLYVLVETLGPDHHRTFRVELHVGSKLVARGEGQAIKVAHQEAARVALKKLTEGMFSSA